ncbi:MAG: hypothetical protein WCO71_07635 [Pseudomonadota bacterium]
MKPSIHLTYLSLILTIATAAQAENQIAYTHPDGHSGREKLTRVMTCYIADGVTGTHDDRCLKKSDGVINVSKIPESAQEELQESFTTGTRLFDLRAIRSWLNTWSYPTRSIRHQDLLITNDLAGFRQSTNFRQWPKEIIERSAIKQKTRVIYRSPEGFSPATSVAECYDSETGDVTAALLETEIAIERLDGSGNADYYSYNPDGQLSSTSRFPAGERPVPDMCLSCHYNASQGIFGRKGPG